jgi:hypothetical protein
VKEKPLSLGRGLVINNLVLSNMLVYMVSFFQLTHEVLHTFDYFQSRFFWQGYNQKSNIDRLNVVLFADPKIKDDSGFMAWRSRIEHFR